MSSEFNPDTKNVSGVQFSIASPEEIRESSVVEITKTETYEKEKEEKNFWQWLMLMKVPSTYSMHTH